MKWKSSCKFTFYRASTLTKAQLITFLFLRLHNELIVYGKLIIKI